MPRVTPTKNNIRSFRYSDEVLAILNNQEGNSLNEKFENLFIFCNFTKPELDNEVKRLERRKQDLIKDITTLMQFKEDIRTVQYLYECSIKNFETRLKNMGIIL